MKVLITDCTIKNSIAIQRELSQRSDLYLIGLTDHSTIFPRIYGYCQEYYRGSIEEAVSKFMPDMIIPVGGKSVLICVNKFSRLVFLSEKSIVNRVLDKLWLAELNKLQGVYYPKAIKISNIDDFRFYWDKGEDSIIKSSNETRLKFDTIYLTKNSSFKELNNIKQKIKYFLEEKVDLLLQEKVDGVGRGFCCIAKDGQIVTYYMHERIRELPLTGGSSTAARSIYCDELEAISARIIKYINWTGPIMLEYKFNSSLSKYYLIEINPKFWGSLDLSYALDLSFGSDLVKLFKGEIIPTVVPRVKYQKGIHYYWPFDGDLYVLFKMKKVFLIAHYFKKDARTNVRSNILVCLIKLFLTLKKILLK